MQPQVRPKNNSTNRLTSGASSATLAAVSNCDNSGGSVLQLVGQSRRNVAAGQGVPVVGLASAESVAGLLASLRRPVRIAGIRQNGLVGSRYRAGDRDWLVLFKA